jgi:hypothetical protein
MPDATGTGPGGLPHITSTRPGRPSRCRVWRRRCHLHERCCCASRSFRSRSRISGRAAAHALRALAFFVEVLIDVVHPQADRTIAFSKVGWLLAGALRRYRRTGMVARKPGAIPLGAITLSLKISHGKFLLLFVNQGHSGGNRRRLDRPIYIQSPGYQHHGGNCYYQQCAYQVVNFVHRAAPVEPTIQFHGLGSDRHAPPSSSPALCFADRRRTRHPPRLTLSPTHRFVHSQSSGSAGDRASMHHREQLTPRRISNKAKGLSGGGYHGNV